MSLQQYSPEQLQEMSLVELAYLVMSDKKEALPFQQLVHEIAALANLTEEEVKARLAQFYTDLNIDGRFICIGENRWGLRSWYPYDQTEDENVTTFKPKKKKKALDEYDDYDDDDIIDEEELDYDDIEDYDDVEDVDLDDELLDDEEFDLDETDEFDDELLDDDFELEGEELDEELDEELLDIDETEEEEE
ncbi:DNA-directed RNA polymerase subunit delta [Anoxybacillus tepidamans]|uniref:Probable DNA-directed RNA polymerase subunit delta n=1 Tax=Anoxybacteroides tepidamans TaxID=265948 RepID=A0A7W8MU19_9BACL|nr:DNA-directed RNA polymerase subunit delta [Anoxybacillus tepidamans]MBB5324027.1 DNA-directed RNA polymerase subunit delta [Anoxybacillus tepidamans]